MKEIKVPDKMTDNPEDRKRQAQEKIILYQLLQRKIEEMRQEILMLEKGTLELEITKRAVEDMEKMKEGNDVLISLGTGCYAQGKSGKTDRVLVNIGGNVMLGKGTRETMDILEKRRAETEKLKESIMNEISRGIEKLNELGKEIQEMNK